MKRLIKYAIEKIMTETVLYMITASAVLMMLLALYKDNRSLAKENQNLRKTVRESQLLRPGDFLPKVEAINYLGEKEKLDYTTESYYLLIIYSLSCQACSSGMPKLISFSSVIKKKNVKIRFISLDPLPQNNAEALPPNAFYVSEPNILHKYKISAIPQIVLVARDGVVEWVHQGIISDESQDELIAKLAALDQISH
jgi:hypothetical protein